jgi:tetratricopeptide (TPR) repeat protein
MIKVLKYLFIIFSVLFFQSFSYSQNFFNEAVELYKKEKYEDARFLFERNIVFNPKDANSYLYLAKIYNQEKNQRKEEYNLETTILIEPDNEEALLMLMKIALEKSNYDKVKKFSDTFLKVCKNLCEENKEIQESLKNIEPEKNES